LLKIKASYLIFVKLPVLKKEVFDMGIEQRILTCRLLEKMNGQKGYSNRLGLENVSTFHGIKINNDSKGSVRKEGRL
jgi:hypothetical protein